MTGSSSPFKKSHTGLIHCERRGGCGGCRRRRTTAHTTPRSSAFMLPSTKGRGRLSLVRSVSPSLSSFLCHPPQPFPVTSLTFASPICPSLPPPFVLSFSLPDFLSSCSISSLPPSLSLCVTGERLSVKMPSCSPDCCLLQAVEVSDLCVFISLPDVCREVRASPCECGWLSVWSDEDLLRFFLGFFPSSLSKLFSYKTRAS